MITNKGNSIIARYLLGQAPEYSSYLALGIGGTPLSAGEYDSSPTSKDSMDFEAFRVPVTSRGLVNDIVTLDLSSWESDGSTAVATTSTPHGVRPGEEITLSFQLISMRVNNGTFVATSTTSNTVTYSYISTPDSWTASGSDTGTLSYSRERIIFKAQLPVDQYYKMTEIAIYPAANNNLAQQFDSKTISGFLPSEQWKTVIDSSESNIFVSSTDLGTDIVSFLNPDSTSASALYINSNNLAFGRYNRKQRYEGPRLYDKSLMVSGNFSTFENDNLNVSSSTNYIETNNISLNASKNSSDDYIKLGVSVISKLYSASSPPDRTRIRLELVDSSTNGKAVIKQILTSSDLSSNRYYVINKKLKDFTIDANFNWGRIGQIKIYSQTVDSSGNPTEDFVVFDGIRLDNVNTENPLYGMVAYSKLKNQYDEALPIEKNENDQGYIEYRIGINIV